ncbi:MAG: O-antigen ligase family protein [Desulfobacteraceae bacterium]|nr:O-antigen ligase family protein [Desulfobacteraceae bacterium]
MLNAAEKFFIYGVYILVAFLPFNLFILWVFPGFTILTSYWKEIIVSIIFIKCFTYRLTNASPLNISSFFFIFIYIAILIIRTACDYFSGQYLYLISYGLYNYTFFIMLAFISNSISWNKEKIEFFFRGLFQIISVVSFFALLDWTFELNRVIDWKGLREGLLGSWHVGSGYRAYLGCDNPMELGLFCSTGQVICLYFILEVKEKKFIRSVANWLCLIVCALGTLVTLSRGPLIANVLSSLYLLLFRIKNSSLKNQVEIFMERIFLIISVAMISVIVTISLSDQGVINHFSAVFDWTEDQANLERVGSWKLGLEKFREHPLWGNGIGFTQTRLDKYRRLTLNWKDTFISEGFLLVLAVEGGTVLLGSFLLITVHLGLTIYKHTRLMKTSWQIFVLLGALFILFYAEAMIMPIFDTRTFVVLFWSFYGITLRLAFQNDMTLRKQFKIDTLYRPWAF